MSGFDNGSLQSGLFFQAKQFGAILRGMGPPVPAAGVMGDLYIDTQTWFLYEKRSPFETDPWGHYIFQVPVALQANLKWFSSSAPGSVVGVTGDYCLLWGGYANYGLQPLVFGPKQASGWAENGEGPNTQYDPAFAGFALPVGVAEEGTAAAFSTSTQVIAVGLDTEFILSIPILTTGGTPVEDVGVGSQPAAVVVNLNPLYTAQDEHAV